ncbi:MAG TPA: PilZ domain-containing protein [Kiloniellaceae bacterium]
MSRSNVTVMRKERRRDRRRSMQAEALLDGRPVQLTDLSAAGFGVALDATDRQPHDFRVGQRLRLEVPVPQGEPLSLPVEIVRPSGENGVVGGIFLDISDAAYNTIEALLTGRFRRRR